MKRLLGIITLALTLTLLGCSDPKLDTSTQERLEISAEKVRASLPEHEASEFDKAMAAITFSSIDFGAVMRGEVSPEDHANRIMASLDGKTGREIIEEGRAIIAAQEARERERAEAERQRQLEREAREREQALLEIQELEELKLGAQKAAEKVASFEVTRARFFIHKDRFSSEPVIEMTVANNTDRAVSRAFFQGVVASPGRSVPWIEESFNYQIPGGIEPGETASWRLAPNRFSAWGREVPEDAILTLTTVKLEGPGYEINSASFTERQADRLALLKARYQPD